MASSNEPHLNRLLSYVTPAVSRLPAGKVTELDNKSLSASTKNGTLTKAVMWNAENSVAELRQTELNKLPARAGGSGRGHESQ